MTQTRIGSLIEALFNVVIGFSINYFANLAVFPLFGFHISLAANFWMGCIYTVISIVRSYVIRRWFNARLQATARRLAERAAAQHPTRERLFSSLKRKQP